MVICRLRNLKSLSTGCFIEFSLNMNTLRSLSKSRTILKTISDLPAISCIKMRHLTSETETSPTDALKFETLAVSVPHPFVYHVELNRPDKRNAMNNNMWTEIQKCFEGLNEDENCRSVVLSGSGSLFCSGIDVQCFMDMGQNFKETDDIARKCRAMLKLIHRYQNSLSSIEKCVKPVIAAVHNACVGAGVDMICSADIRYCTSDAWFQIKEVDIGLAADVGTMQRLPKIIGSQSLARELVFTGRKFPAQEAKEYGFVSKIFDSKEQLIEESLKVAQNIAQKSPVAVQTAKKSLIYSRDHSVEEGLEHIALMNQAMLQSEDVMTAIMANFNKSSEPPVFSKL